VGVRISTVAHSIYSHGGHSGGRRTVDPGGQADTPAGGGQADTPAGATL
jgi:hypothetical protein